MPEHTYGKVTVEKDRFDGMQARIEALEAALRDLTYVSLDGRAYVACRQGVDLSSEYPIIFDLHVGGTK